MNAGTHSAQTYRPATARAGPVTVVLVDNQQLIRSALRHALLAAGLQVVGQAGTADAAVQAVVDLRPDVVLMDFEFPGTSGVEAIERMSLLAPASRILVLAATRERHSLVQAIVAGACGYILKEAGSEAIVEGVLASAGGQCVISPDIAGDLLTRIRERDIPVTAASEHAADAIRAELTERELEIFKRLASGESNQEIGHELQLSANTVKNHVGSILAKLHLHNRIQAAVHAVRSGLSCVTPALALPLFGGGDLSPSAVLAFFLGG
jgi:DNA-binding NarL/FixJ family response regulator